jgi:hypothetical protein
MMTRVSFSICNKEKEKYQVLIPDEDTFILKGWDYNPETRGKVWYISLLIKKDMMTNYCTVVL